MKKEGVVPPPEVPQVPKVHPLEWALDFPFRGSSITCLSASSEGYPKLVSSEYFLARRIHDFRLHRDSSVK